MHGWSADRAAPSAASGRFPSPSSTPAACATGSGNSSGAIPNAPRASAQRSRQAVARLADFPGDRTTGILDEDEEAEERFAALPDEEYCPALDPVSLTCDLYDARPITCRIFGPAVRSGGDVLGVCELNYQGATDEQIAACQVEVDPSGLEDELLQATSATRRW